MIRALMQDLSRDHSLGFKNVPEIAQKQRVIGADVVVLTGTTGALGPNILASLLQNERVRRVYRPSRDHDITHRQRSPFEDQGLDTTLLQSKKL